MQVSVVKVGGSVVAPSAGAVTGLQADRLAALAVELRSCGRLVLVHGSGVYGKLPAIANHYLDGHLGPDKSSLVSAISSSLEQLHEAVLAAMRRADIACLPTRVHDLFFWSSGRLQLHLSNSLEAMLERSLTPVVGSGFVADYDRGGYAVASSDAMASALAALLGASRLVFATSAHGVYREYPHTDHWHEHLAADDTAAIALIEKDTNDVTGGMLEKLRWGFEAASRGIETLVVDGRSVSNVGASVRGEPFIGTRLHASTHDLKRATSMSLQV